MVREVVGLRKRGERVSAEKNVLGAILGEMVSLNRLDLEPSDFTESKKHEALYALLLNAMGSRLAGGNGICCWCCVG